MEAKCMLGNGNYKRMVKSEAIKEVYIKACNYRLLLNVIKVFEYHSRRPPTEGERDEALKHQILGIIAPLVCVPPTMKTIPPPMLQKIVPKPPGHQRRKSQTNIVVSTTRSSGLVCCL
ncbi:zinc finger matrin-type protein [Gossypium australe]|uniref:Zinc finger matrin-type protein n=1 Tax=Gossypium australe TaxID=47621 RepID=A0A5B6UTL3_9ROSI|nr:zinc finger matrin-type protein [Gossypium australe]